MQPWKANIASIYLKIKKEEGEEKSTATTTTVIPCFLIFSVEALKKNETLTRLKRNKIKKKYFLSPPPAALRIHINTYYKNL